MTSPVRQSNCYRGGDLSGALDALARMEEANLTVMAGMERILRGRG